LASKECPITKLISQRNAGCQPASKQNGDFEKKTPSTRRLAARVPFDSKMSVIRHVDAGNEEAIEFAERNNVKVPMSN